MICPFLSTATPLGPISLPAPILFYDSQTESVHSVGTFSFICAVDFIFLVETTHLKLAIWGEDANPSVVVVSYNNVAVHVDCDPCGALQLPRWTTSDTKPHLKLSIIWKYLEIRIQLVQNINNEELIFIRTWQNDRHRPVCTGCCCLPQRSVHYWRSRCLVG